MNSKKDNQSDNTKPNLPTEVIIKSHIEETDPKLPKPEKIKEENNINAPVARQNNFYGYI